MPTARDRNSFGNAFLQAFNAVDSARHRRDRNALLEDQLEEAKKDRAASRKRTAQFDRERAEDRAIAAEDRTEADELRVREREANALMADPDVPSELLQPYAGQARVAQFLSSRDGAIREDAKNQQASRNFYDEIALNSQPQPGAVAPSATAQQPGTQLQSDVVGAAQLPEPPGGQPSLPVVSEAEIDRIGATQGHEVALAYRQVRTDAQAKQDEASGVEFSQFKSSKPMTPERIAEMEQNQLDRRASASTVEQWTSFNKISDVSGDALRALDSSILSAKYFEDRSTLVRDMSPQEVHEVDVSMAPHLAKTVETQKRILASSEPNTPEARNANRKLGEAYGTQQAIFGDRKPLALAGVDARGLSTNGTNEALTNAVIEQGIAAAPPPYPDNARRTRADMTMVARGTSGRVSEKLAQASWRLMKAGIIDASEYDHVMRTGRRSTTAPIIKEYNPKNDLIAVGSDGQVKTLIYGTDSEKGLDALRNTFSPEVTAQMNKWASALDDESDNARGTNTLASFGAAVASNEGFLRAKQYDLGNINDAYILWQRYLDTAVLKHAIDDEFLMDGKRVDFTQTYGSIFQAMFDPRLDKIDRSELEIEGTTTFGMGGETPQLQPLKPRNPAEIDAALSLMPPGTTREEAEAAIVERENAGLL